jgi:hypothetical protein
MGARETLAAIRAKAKKAPAAVPAETPIAAQPQQSGPRATLARIRTNALDAQGITGAEVKRRAAAGEPIVQTGTRAGSRGEQAGALGVEAVTGVAEGLGGMVGIGIDATRDVMTAGPVRRGARAALQVIRGEKVTPDTLNPPMTATATATAAADDLRRTIREKTGLDGVEVGPTGDVVRAVANVVTPGPELVGAARQLRRGATVAEEITPTIADLAPRASEAILSATDDAAVAAPELAIRRFEETVLPNLNDTQSARVGRALADVRSDPSPAAIGRFVDEVADEFRSDSRFDVSVREEAEALRTGVTPPRTLSDVWVDYQTARREADDAQKFITDAEDRLGRTVSAEEATDPHFMMRLRTEIGGEPEVVSPSSQVKTWRDAHAKWKEVAKRKDALERELDEVAAREASVPAEDVRPQALGGGNRAIPDNVTPIRTADAPPPLDDAIQAARETATRDTYSRFIGPLDEMDAGVGERYMIDEMFDGSSSPKMLERGRKIYDSFAAARELLKKKHGDTMRLVRYDPPASTHIPNRTVLHWSEPTDRDFLSGAHKSVAEEGAERTLRDEQIPIDDIVAAPSYGPGKRQEFIVLNRQSPATVRSPGGDPPPTGGGAGSPPSGTGGAAPSGGGEIPKYSRPSAINLERQNVADDVKRWEADTAMADGIREELEAIKGAPLTNAEVAAASKRGRLLTDVTTRESTVNLAADMLASRNELARMAKEGKATIEYLDLQAAVSSKATELGRLLNTLNIDALADDAGSAAMREVTKQLEQIGKTSDEIAEALKDVDFNDPAQATKAYEQHIKPRLTDLLEAFRYSNLLSNPRTHGVNLSTNLSQAYFARPADIMASGVIDWFGSKLRGNVRVRYVADVGPYYRGSFSAIKPATGLLFDVMTGRRPIRNPDLQALAIHNALPAPLRIVPRLLDGVDQMTSKMIEAGEFEALAHAAKKAGRAFDEVAGAKEAATVADEYVFRNKLSPTEYEDVKVIGKDGRARVDRRAIPSPQGHVLAKIDDFTSRIIHVLNTKTSVTIGGRTVTTRPGRWLIPFVNVPTNVFKWGLQRGPFGFVTMIGSTRKGTQAARAMVGSAVWLGAGIMAFDDRTTWNAPRNAKDRAAFDQAGMQPYSMKIGDHWVSYEKLGPFGFPFALAAAMKFYSDEDPEASGNMDLALFGNVMGALTQYFADQSYVTSLRDMFSAPEDERTAAKLTSNVASQMIPASGLLRAVTHVIDPVYRKASGKNTLEGVWQNLRRDLPFLSESVPPRLMMNGEEKPRQYPVLNAISPLQISKEDPQGARQYRDWMEMRRKVARSKRGSAE